ncbi:MAG: hypothetical protein ACR2KT_06890 [Methylocella sp.]
MALDGKALKGSFDAFNDTRNDTSAKQMLSAFAAESAALPTPSCASTNPAPSQKTAPPPPSAAANPCCSNPVVNEPLS